MSDRLSKLGNPIGQPEYLRTLAKALDSFFRVLMSPIARSTPPADKAAKKMVTYPGEDQKIDPETADAIKRLADVAKPGITYRELIGALQKASFERSFEEAVVETPPARKEKEEPAQPETPKTQKKPGAKPKEKTSSQQTKQDGKAADTAADGATDIIIDNTADTIEQKIADEAYATASKRAEAWKPSSYEDQYEYYFREAAGEPPPQSEVEDQEMKERRDRLDEFVNQITGRRD